MKHGSFYSYMCCTPTLLQTGGFYNGIDVKGYQYCLLHSIVSITEYEGVS